MPHKERPDQITLVDDEFDTTEQQDAARAILWHWEETQNLSEIARRSGYSSSHLNNVYHKYFKPAENGKKPVDVEPDSKPNGNDSDDEIRDSLELRELEIYRLGFKDGWEARDRVD